MPTTTTSDWTALQDAIDGEVVLPEGPGYDELRKPVNTRFHDVRPLAVVRCAGPADVAETLALADSRRIPFAVRSGGHCFAGRSSSTGIVIDVRPMAATSLDGELMTAGSGAQLGEVYAAAAVAGRTLALGCGPDVGIAGLALGGGFGLLGRRHGLVCDQLVGAQVVLADGRVLDCDEHRDADLFWALRGAGSSVGVVTRLTLRTVEAVAATGFHLGWGAEDATAVVDAWQRWAPSATDDLAASLKVIGTGAPHVFGMVLGSRSTAEGLLAELESATGAAPSSVELSAQSTASMKTWFNDVGDRIVGASDAPGYELIRSEFHARPLPVSAIEELLARLTQPAAGHRELDFSPWGGAYNRVRPDATAFPHRSAQFLLKHSAVVTTGASTADRAAVTRWLADSWATAHAFGTGGAYPNFPDPDLTDGPQAYYGANLPRLRRVKARYDPTELFRFPQSIPREIDHE